jgi:AcrR family transcriptional regulator
MSDIAKATGLSRQAVYLGFSSRTALMIETTH